MYDEICKKDFVCFKYYAERRPTAFREYLTSDLLSTEKLCHTCKIMPST